MAPRDDDTHPHTPDSSAVGSPSSSGQAGKRFDETFETNSTDNNNNNNTLDDDELDNDNNNSPEQQQEKLISCMTGMHADLRARWPLYADDWGRPQNMFTVLNATIFAFVIQLIPALIFAELMDRETEGNLAIAETLLSSAIIGIIYAIFAGQPLVLMGITGPVALLLGTSYGLTEKFDSEYFPFFFWICLWAGLMHMISAAVGLVQLVWSVTPFTSQIFELFIAVTFIFTSIRDLVEPIYLGQGGEQDDRAAQYATLVLGAITCWIAWTLHFAETWVYFTRQVRIFLTSYNTAIACVVVTALSYLPGVDLDDTLDRVNIRYTPWDWKPTADRSWVVNPFEGIDAKGIMAAFVPGFMFFLLFIIDHNVSSILTQSPKYNLKKPPAYHWDFFVLGVTFLPCALLGLPPGNGLIPQAPLHCRALCTRKYVVDEKTGLKKEVVTHCEEQRWSGLGQALLMLVALSLFTVLSWIPRGVLFGLFLYLGMGALHGNEIWERLLLCFVLAKKRPEIPVVERVEWKSVVAWTLVQSACALVIFAVAQFASFGYIYPALLTALVPFRSYVLSRWFHDEDIKYLDPFGESEEDYHRDQKEFQQAQHRGSFDEEDVEFITRGMFRGYRGPNGEVRRRHSIGHTEDILPSDIQVDHVIPSPTNTSSVLVQMLDAHEKSKDIRSTTPQQSSGAV